ncbi:hypothetical protein [Solibacillus sp. CAU 1738]|uniref:hypothetical protein n=1 Tax=Solibacillus sp. CAU 1738 TaxID=3140363 RepID=UPI00326020C2
MLYYVLLFSTAIILGIVIAMFNLPFWTAVVVIIGISFIHLGYNLYTIYRSKNMQAIAKYIEKNKKHPLYAYAFSTANGSVNEQVTAIDVLLAKYKSPYMQAIYKMNRALLTSDFELAMREVENIAEKPLGQYGIALIYALQGDRENATSINLQNMWQQACIDAVLAYREQSPTYHAKKQQAIEASRGIQRYTNYYFFESIEKTMPWKV